FSGHVPRAFATPAKVLARAAALTRRALAPALAVVSPHLRIRLRQAAQRRPHLARSHRADLSLRNAAAAHLARVVCASTAGLVPESFDCRDVRDRVGAAVSYLRAQPPAPV